MKKTVNSASIWLIHQLEYGLLIFTFLVLCCQDTLAVGELSTKFNIYVPPNNKSNGNDVVLTVTAFQNNTTVNIFDDGSDGDTDDTYENILLNEGQTFILYMKEGVVNDDALGKWDGDYFIITASHPVSVMQATTSSYQHDWLPAENKTMGGKKFIFYNPPGGDSPNELNLYSYNDSTDVAVYDITAEPRVISGITSVSFENQPIIKTRLNQGEDLISVKNIGKNGLQAGHTYLVNASKPVTAQFGALYEKVRDGGGFVPSANGSAVGDLFYFCVPGEPDKKEIRILSFENNAEIRLFGWMNGWELIDVFMLNQLDHGDWVSQYEGYELFKVVSVTGENISVFESNWLETSDEPGTADITTFAASELGYGAGTRFVCYMPPPGDQGNVEGQGTRYTHLFLYGHAPNTTVQIYDTDSQGSKINRTVYLQENDCYDFKLNTIQYNSIYNGTGNPDDGPERPYLNVVSDQRIAVMISNWSDNWLTFGASVLLPLPKIKYSVNPSFIQGPSQAVFSGILTNFGDANLVNCTATVTLPKGVEYLALNWEKEGNVVITDLPSGETQITCSSFEIGIDADVAFSISANIPDPGESQPTGLGNTFMSRILLGGYSDGDYYETSEHVIIFVVEKIPLLPPAAFSATCNNGSIQLNWSRSLSSNIIGYYIYRSLNSTEGFERVWPELVSDTTFVDAQVFAENLYYYFIVAVNNWLIESEPSMIASASPTCGGPLLTAPVLLAAEPDSFHKAINLCWTIENRVRLNGFWLHRAETAEKGYKKIRQFAAQDTSFADTSVAYNITYFYRVTAFDADLTETNFSNELFAQIEQRPVPVLLSAVPDSTSKSISLTWTIAFREQVMAFSVYRSQTSGADFQRIGFLPVSDTSFVDLSVQYNEQYFYIVRASYLTGVLSPFSNELAATIYSLPTPVLQQVRPDSATQSMKLVWTIERRALIAGFRVYRQILPDGPFEFLVQTLPADTVFTDLPVEFEITYSYAVTAFDELGNESLFSNVLSARLDRATATPRVQLLNVRPDSLIKSMTLMWTATEIRQIVQFRVYRSETPGGPYKKINQITAPDTTFRDADVEFNRHYYYVISALKKSGTETAYSNEKSGFIFYLPTPELLKAAPDSVALSIELEWQVEPSDVISGFIIYRSAAGEPYRVLAEVLPDNRFFTDTEVMPDIRYAYQVRCFDETGNLSRFSNQQSAILTVPKLPETVFAYPNPCAEALCQQIHFRFALKKNADVTIDVYDLAGDLIYQLKGEGIGGKWNELVWDVSLVASDVYLFVFQAKNQVKGYVFQQIGKIAVVK